MNAMVMLNCAVFIIIMIIICEINGDDLSNMRHEANRDFGNKKREYLKDKINELATSSKNKNMRGLHRGISKFKRGYQPRNILVNIIIVICLQIHTAFAIGSMMLGGAPNQYKKHTTRGAAHTKGHRNASIQR
jgi:hypothetical protein